MPIRKVSLYGSSDTKIRITIKGPNPEIGHVAVAKVLEIGTTLHENTKISIKNLRQVKVNSFGERVDGPTGPIVRDVTYNIHNKSNQSFNSIATALEIAQANGPVVTYMNNTDEQLICLGDIMNWILPKDMPQGYIFQITTQGIS